MMQTLYRQLFDTFEILSGETRLYTGRVAYRNEQAFVGGAAKLMLL